MLNTSFNIRETQRLVCPALWLCRPFQWRVMYNILLRYDTSYHASLWLFYLKRYLIDWNFFLDKYNKTASLAGNRYIFRPFENLGILSFYWCKKVRLKATLINKHTKNWNCAKCEISLRTRKIFYDSNF